MLRSPVPARPCCKETVGDSAGGTLEREIVPASLVSWRCESVKQAGTVVARYDAAISFICIGIVGEISSGDCQRRLDNIQR